MTSKFAAAAVGLLMLSGLTGTQVPNHSVHLSEQVTSEAPATVAKEPDPAPQPVTPAPVIVTVQPGDTLTSIAQAYNTTYQRIFNANDFIADPNIIHPGQELRIPADDEQLPDRPLPVAAPTAVATPLAATRTAQVATTAAAVYPVSANDAKAFIYSRESGNNPNATSPNGCYGLGQDCNGRVRSLCGADYACQDQYFTSYAIGRYGSWENAQAFWLAHHWW